MTDLTTFLLARIAEDESEARKAGDRFGGGPWEYDDNYNVAGHPPFGGPVRASVQDPSIGRHIARWDPDRVLAECEAKRQLVELHKIVTVDYAGEWWTVHSAPAGTYVRTGCTYCTTGGVDGEERIEDGPCPTLELLALPYADHADYDQEWRP